MRHEFASLRLANLSAGPHQCQFRSNHIALFIDGANLHATARTLGFEIDYKRLLKEFEGRGSLLRAFYYTAISEDQEYSSLRPLTDWLSYNGYTVVTKAVKEFMDASGRRKFKGNMDVELAVDAMEIAGQIDQMVLFSGDGSFRSLVEAVQRRGVRVTVISTISSQPPMIADELRRQADVFTDLAELQSELSRDPSERPTPARGASVWPAVGFRSSRLTITSRWVKVDLHAANLGPFNPNGGFKELTRSVGAGCPQYAPVRSPAERNRDIFHLLLSDR